MDMHQQASMLAVENNSNIILKTKAAYAAFVFLTYTDSISR